MENYIKSLPYSSSLWKLQPNPKNSAPNKNQCLF
jgi:hypothetical protein